MNFSPHLVARLTYLFTLSFLLVMGAVDAQANLAPKTPSLTAPPTVIMNGRLNVSARSHDPENQTVTYNFVFRKGTTVLFGVSNTSGSATFDLSTVGSENAGDVLTTEVTASDGQLTSAATTANTTVTELNSLVVTTLSDNSSNIDGLTSLREAVTFSNRDSDTTPEIITFNVGGTITLRSSLPTLGSATTAGALTIRNTGSSGVTLSGGGLVRLFDLSFADLTLDRLTLSGGKAASGGAISIGGGTLRVNNCILSGNEATSNSNGGGAILHLGSGAVTISNSTLSGNSANSSDGGAINNYGFGTLTITGSTLSGNSANDGGDAGNGGTGGAISNRDGNVSILNSTLSGNTAVNGAAIHSYATVTILNSTLANNRAVNNGGAIINQGRMTITNSTLARNSAANYGGGAIRNISYAGNLSISNSTVTGNSAGGSSLGGGGISNDATLNLKNSLVVGNSAPAGANVSGSFNDQGNNLIAGTAAQAGLQTDNNDAPVLADNGGPTNTIALVGGSAAINAGQTDTAGLPDFDQRGTGYPRVKGARVDIGAFESDTSSSPTPNVQAAVNSPTTSSSALSPGERTALTVDVTDADGADDLRYVHLMLSPQGSSPSSPASGLWMHFNFTERKLYVWNGTGWGGGVTLGTPGTLTTAQGTIDVGASSIVSIPNGYRISIVFIPNSSFTGTFVLRALPQDTQPLNGWDLNSLREGNVVTIGSSNVQAQASSPTASPTSLAPGQNTTLSVDATDANGAADLRYMHLMLSPQGSSLSDPRSGLWLHFNFVEQKLYAWDGTGWGNGAILGSGGTLTTAQGTINVAQSALVPIANGYRFSIVFSPNSGFTGIFVVRALPQDTQPVNGWDLGSMREGSIVTIGAPNVQAQVNSPWASPTSLAPGERTALTVDVTDANGAGDLRYVHLMLSPQGSSLSAPASGLWTHFNFLKRRLYTWNGTDWGNGAALSSPGVLTTAQGSIDVGASSCVSIPNGYRLSIAFIPNSSYLGTFVLRALPQDARPVNGWDLDSLREGSTVTIGNPATSSTSAAKTAPSGGSS
jgi:hypothetical protein